MCAYLFSIVAEIKKGLKNEKPWASYFAKQFSRVNRMGMAFNGECNKRDEVVVEYLNISTYLFIRMNHTTMYSFRASKNEIFTEKCLLKNIHVWIFFLRYNATIKHISIFPPSFQCTLLLWYTWCGYCMFVKGLGY